MATKTISNGTEKKATTTRAKKELQTELAKKASGSQSVVAIKASNGQKPEFNPVVNLDERINRFEKLRGLANKREKLVQTLADLTRFNYNTDEAQFYLKDASGATFSTGNTNLIKLVTSQLQGTLEQRKTELEAEIMVFEL